MTVSDGVSPSSKGGGSWGRSRLGPPLNPSLAYISVTPYFRYCCIFLCCYRVRVPATDDDRTESTADHPAIC